MLEAKKICKFYILITLHKTKTECASATRNQKAMQSQDNLLWLVLGFKYRLKLRTTVVNWEVLLKLIPSNSPMISKILRFGAWILIWVKPWRSININFSSKAQPDIKFSKESWATVTFSKSRIFKFLNPSNFVGGLTKQQYNFKWYKLWHENKHEGLV